MRKAKQSNSLHRSILVIGVVCTIALLLMLSLAFASAAGHSFDHIVLALPAFFFVLVVAASAHEWLRAEDPSFDSRVWASAAHTRAPPRPLS